MLVSFLMKTFNSSGLNSPLPFLSASVNTWEAFVYKAVFSAKGIMQSLKPVVQHVLQGSSIQKCFLAPNRFCPKDGQARTFSLAFFQSSTMTSNLGTKSHVLNESWSKLETLEILYLKLQQLEKSFRKDFLVQTKFHKHNKPDFEPSHTITQPPYSIHLGKKINVKSHSKVRSPGGFLIKNITTKRRNGEMAF